MKIWRSIFLAFVMVAIARILVMCLMIWRGFRATATPSAFETLVARIIPCASCHRYKSTARTANVFSSNFRPFGQHLLHTL